MLAGFTLVMGEVPGEYFRLLTAGFGDFRIRVTAFDIIIAGEDQIIRRLCVSE